MSLHIETLGRGSDLLMLHGWALHGGVWDRLRERLRRDFRLHLLDLPGHGRSPLGNSQSFDAWVSQISAQMPERAAICGWSLGGQIALELAAREPTKVERVILISTTPSFVIRENWAFGIEPGVLQQFERGITADYAATLRRFLALQTRGGAHSTQALQELRRTLLACGGPVLCALKAGLRMLRDNDLRNRAREVAQPTLVLHGDRDALCPPQAGDWLARNLPNARLRLLPHCGHAPFASHPGEFADILTDFLHEN